MKEGPTGWTFVLTMPLAILCLMMADVSGWWQLPAVAIGMTLAVVAAFSGLYWLFFHAARWAAIMKDTSLMTVARATARDLHGLTPEALSIVDRSQRAAVDAGIAAEGLQFFLRGTDIDFDFLDEFLEHSQGMYLAPVRTWSEGSIGRINAEELTKWFIHLNWAMVGVGNKPARWVNGMTTWRVRSIFFGTADKEMKPESPSPTPPEGHLQAKTA